MLARSLRALYRFGQLFTKPIRSVLLFLVETPSTDMSFGKSPRSLSAGRNQRIYLLVPYLSIGTVFGRDVERALQLEYRTWDLFDQVLT